MFAFGGFESALVPMAEAKNPRRDAPFALGVGLLVIATCYFLIHIVAMWAVPDLAGSARPLADAARIFAGPIGAALMACAALLSAYGWLSGAFVTLPRLIFALGERGDFPRPLGAVHPTFRTPHIAILLWAAAMLALAIYGSFIWNAILAGVARIVTYAVTCGALIQLRRKNPRADAWRAPGGVVLALAGFAFCFWLGTRMTGTHAAIMGVVAVIGTVNWLVVRTRREVPVATELSHS
jgi:APA family basic amino acid/polyamine antiporter